MLKRQSNSLHLRGQAAVLRRVAGGKTWMVTLLGSCRRGWQIFWESWRVRYSQATFSFSLMLICALYKRASTENFFNSTIHSQSCRTSLSTLSKSSQMLLRPPLLQQRPPPPGSALRQPPEHQLQRHPYQTLPILSTAL